MSPDRAAAIDPLIEVNRERGLRWAKSHTPSTSSLPIMTFKAVVAPTVFQAFEGAIAILALRTLYQWWTGYNGSSLPYPPGPKGYPIINNLFDMPIEDPWAAHAELAKKYGRSLQTFALSPYHWLIVFRGPHLLSSVWPTDYDCRFREASHRPFREAVLDLLESTALCHDARIVRLQFMTRHAPSSPTPEGSHQCSHLDWNSTTFSLSLIMDHDGGSTAGCSIRSSPPL